MAYLDENSQNSNELNQVESNEISSEVNEEVSTEIAEDKTVSIKEGKSKKSKKGTNQAKATVSELKKVSWLSFPKVVKQTSVVLAVTAIFLLVILGIDQLLYLLYDLLTKNM